MAAKTDACYIRCVGTLRGIELRGIEGRPAPFVDGYSTVH